MDAHLEELLRRLALNDDTAVERVLQMSVAADDGTAIDAKTSALVRLAGLIALRSSASTYGWSVEAALATGATDREIAAVMVAIAPVVGVARVSEAAAEIATSLGYELDLPDWE